MEIGASKQILKINDERNVEFLCQKLCHGSMEVIGHAENQIGPPFFCETKQPTRQPPTCGKILDIGEQAAERGTFGTTPNPIRPDGTLFQAGRFTSNPTGNGNHEVISFDKMPMQRQTTPTTMNGRNHCADDKHTGLHETQRSLSASLWNMWFIQLPQWHEE